MTEQRPASRVDEIPRCQGFGDQETCCLNAAVTPARIWCWPCEDKRRAHITTQMEAITASFPDRPGGPA